jgi:hypothetical protein
MAVEQTAQSEAMEAMIGGGGRSVRMFMIAVASTSIGMACSAAPTRLEPEAAATSRSVTVQSIIRSQHLAVEPNPFQPPVRGLLGGLLAAGVQISREEAANERLNPLETATVDLDFEADYAVPLVRMVRTVSWLRAAESVRSRGDLPAQGAGDAANRGLLRIETRQTLSPDSASLALHSVFEFYASAGSRTPSARVETTYRSEPIGDVTDGDAVARWAADSGKAYRRARAEAIPESLKLGRMALESLVKAPDGGGGNPEVEIRVCVFCGHPGIDRKLDTVKLIGTIADETATRLVLRGGGAFYSLPISAVIVREIRSDRADLP